MKNNKILIIGKIPPPIGGVTIHNKRLLESLKKTDLDFEFYDTTIFKPLHLLMRIFSSRLIHLQLSSPYLRFFLSFICFCLFKQSINTIHGDLGRFPRFKNIIDYLSVFFSSNPILLNKKSLLTALKFNKKSKLIPAFIPPQKHEYIDIAVVDKIKNQKNVSNRLIYCTNASTFGIDKQGKEIYGIISLVDIFKKNQNNFLIISDPSSSYKNYILKEEIILTDNILVISEKHSFFEIIKLSDVFLRTTTTDGDSLSVKEALFLKKTVIVSDCVERPEGVILYKTGDEKDLELKIIEVKNKVKLNYTIIDGSNLIIKLYKELLKANE